MSAPFILAHDLGTTGNKATLFDAQGNAVEAILKTYGTDHPRPNWVEQNPDDWREAVFESTQTLISKSHIDPGQIAVVSFSGHMQGAVFVDQQGAPLRSAIIWADQRATEQAAYISEVCGAENVYRRTGQRVSAAYSAAKVLWVKQHQPEIFAQTCKVLQAKDYAAFLLTGEFATDYSDASGTQMFNLERRCWDDELLQALGLSAELFPRAQPSTTVVGQVSAAAATATGLLAGTPVVIGGGDGACATVGAGSVREGEAYTCIGSSSWISLTTARPIFDPKRRTFTFAHLDPELYMPIGTMQAAGGARDWALRCLREDDEQADTLMNQVPAGAEGLLFLPYLLGERSPHWNPKARGSWIGLSMSHHRGHLLRAVLEGVAFNLKMILDLLVSQGVKVEAMRLIGGGARSSLWRQIVADIYQLPLLRPQLDTEATALGAAVAGGIGVGIFDDFKVVHKLIPAIAAETPDAAHQAVYSKLYKLFQQSYDALEPVYERLADLADAPRKKRRI